MFVEKRLAGILMQKFYYRGDKKYYKKFTNLLNSLIFKFTKLSDVLRMFDTRWTYVHFATSADQPKHRRTVDHDL